MKGSNLKSFAIGVIIAAGLGVAVTLPAPFAAQEALSAKKLNDYFDAIKTAINNLEAPNSVTTEKIAPGAVGNTDLADNAITSSKIANGSLTAEDIQDEPGGAQNRNFQATSLGPTETTIVNTTLDAPRDGFALVMAYGTLCMTHANASFSDVLISVSTTVQLVSVRPFIPPAAASGLYCQPFSMQTIEPVPSGKTTFSLKIQDKRINSPANTVTVDGGSRLTAVYLPTAHGTIQ